MSELTDLLNRYGLSNASRMAASNASVMSTDTSDPDYAAQMEAYLADQQALTDYQKQFDTRSKSFDLYGKDSWSGDKLSAPQLKSRRPVPKAVIAAVAQPAALATQSTGGGSGSGGSGLRSSEFNTPSAASSTSSDRYNFNPINAAGYNLSVNPEKAGLGFMMAGPLGAVAGLKLSADPLGAFMAKQVPLAEDRWAAQAAADQAAQQAAAGGLGSMPGQSPDTNTPAQNEAMAAALSRAGYYGSNADGVTQGYGVGADGGSDDGSGNMARGGAVKKYAEGGLHELNQKYAPPGATALADIPGNQGLDISRVSPEQLAVLQEQDPAALQRGVSRFGDQAVSEPVVNPIQALYDKVINAPSEYADEYKAARERSAAAQDKFNKLIEQQLSAQQDSGPSKAEMYFNLAAAFGAPTRTGSFWESSANASKVMGETQKAARESKAASRAEAARLGLTVAQQQALAAREEESGLRQLTAEEMRGKRALSIEALKEKYKSESPQSEAGKVAVDAGLKRGTKAYTDFVNSYTEKKLEEGNAIKNLTAGIAQDRLNLAKKAEERREAEGKKLTPGEMKLKTETEDRAVAIKQATADLKKAYSLNPNTFDATLGDRAQRVALENLQSDHPKVKATREMENLLKSNMITSAAEKMKGVLSDSDIKLLTDVQGLGARGVKERAEIMMNAFAALKRAEEAINRRLADVTSGKYRETTPEPTAPVEQ